MAKLAERPQWRSTWRYASPASQQSLLAAAPGSTAARKVQLLAKKKQIGAGSITGDKGIAFIHRTVLDMGFVWNATHLEAGIDGYIEIRDTVTGDMTNCILQVQSKAGSSWLRAETNETFEFICDDRDLTYWLAGNTPVILVVSRPEFDEGYWKSIKDYFADPQRRKSRKIVFDKRADRFSPDSGPALRALAIPDDSGLYLTAIPLHETLVTNLLPLERYPHTLFRARTVLRYPDQVWARLNFQGGGHLCEWVLFDGYLYSVHDLEVEPWRQCCLPASVQRLAMKPWAVTHDTKQRFVFTRLMTCCLNALLRAQYVRFWKDKNHYFFRPTPDLSEKKVGGLSVFKGYPSKTAPDRIAYYRHRAMRYQWQRFDGQWYGEITPSYHFTQNGFALSPYFEERLSNIKLLERQNKVHLRQVRLWEEVLRQIHLRTQPDPEPLQRGLFDDEGNRKPEPLVVPYPHLTFGKLVEFVSDCSVPEIAWLPAETAATPADESAAWSSGGLFS